MPKRTAFVRFREKLVNHELDRVLFEEITARLRDRAVMGNLGMLIVICGVCQPRSKPGRPSPQVGSRLQGAYERDVSPVEKVAVTPGNACDGNQGEDALPDSLGEVCPGCCGKTFANAVGERGGTLLTIGLRVPKHPEGTSHSEERMAEHDRHVHRIRAASRRFPLQALSRPTANALAGALAGARLQAYLTRACNTLAAEWTPSGLPPLAVRSESRNFALRNAHLALQSGFAGHESSPLSAVFVTTSGASSKNCRERIALRRIRPSYASLMT